jgi:hypothetical protein
MNAKGDSPLKDAPSEFSLTRGGPFFRFQQGIGLIRVDGWNLGSRIALFIAITWLPLILLTLFLNPKALLSVLMDYRVHSRMLISVPVFLIGEAVVESRFRAVLQHIRRASLLELPAMTRLDEVISKLVRVRDAFLPELVILMLLIIHSALSYRSLVDTTPWLGYGTPGNVHLTAAGWYAVVISSSVFQFLLGLALWKWLLWTYFAYKLSKSDLKLVPTHPDQHGGLGFLGLTSAAFAPIAFCATAVIASTWRNDILHHGAHLINFKLPAIALVVLIALVALGPLVFFAPRLAELRRRGILDYGILGQLHSTDFHEKWILNRSGHESEFLQAPESSTLADYGQAYENIEGMSPFLVDKGALYTLGAAILIPALPTILAEIPLAVVIGDLLRALH